jgi:Ion channel
MGAEVRMRLLMAIPALLLIMAVLLDAFETIILPRRVVRRLRLTRTFYRSTWTAWRTLGSRLPTGPLRESFLSTYGPLSLLLLLALWAVTLVFGFGMLQWSLGSNLRDPQGDPRFFTDLYFSGTTFFTLGLGDIAPATGSARVVTVVEAGTGFAFLALVVGYLPVLYQAFSARELQITLLDARAGSPPTAVELLSRLGDDERGATLHTLLVDWEHWCAELLESHLSYPLLAYYRSQHDNHSWLAALTMVLDASALVISGIDGIPAGQTRLTFAMARHTAVDLSQIFVTSPRFDADRLSAGELLILRERLAARGISLAEETEVAIADLRRLYEPYLVALSDHLLMPLPPWLSESGRMDAWQSTAWPV